MRHRGRKVLDSPSSFETASLTHDLAKSGVLKTVIHRVMNQCFLLTAAVMLVRP